MQMITFKATVVPLQQEEITTGCARQNGMDKENPALHRKSAPIICSGFRQKAQICVTQARPLSINAASNSVGIWKKWQESDFS
eukprot:CAMPEP_0172663974 /NCGR_PEP_ID=MMETSP1074-20121228/6288_1 /TAXON_ID=2916 /ORGANISM="Ceratium fusus, Strain PA161109" /LENGTH=82 /DNA_ID=CAMNT_0013480051 /DNA_START=103 /DNA_END=348 /DNA_ORIENTATION=-